MLRRDYAFPFRIDAGSGQAARTGYEAHVEQMIRQVLLTSPGERADLPEFGCGVRRLLFAPSSDALAATMQLLVLQALNRWLAREIEVTDVRVVAGESAPDPAEIFIQIEYVLIETQTGKSLRLPVV